MVNLANYKTQIEEAKTTRTNIPSGDYVVVCVSTEEKENSKRNGHYIQNEYEIQEGEYKGEKLIDRINHDNPNETARNIAFATLKALGAAIGVGILTNTEQLIGKRIIAKVKNEASDRPILDDNGMQRVDIEGNPLFYRNVNISKYTAYRDQSKKAQNSAFMPQEQKTGGAFPFPK